MILDSDAINQETGRPAPCQGLAGSSSSRPADVWLATCRTRCGRSSPGQAWPCRDQLASQRTPAPNPGSSAWPEGRIAFHVFSLLEPQQTTRKTVPEDD